MRYKATIGSHFFANILPEKLEGDDHASRSVTDLEIIINEFDKSVDPLCNYGPERGFTVGVKATVESTICATKTYDQYGEYKAFDENITLKQAVNVINELAEVIHKQIVGKPDRA